LSITQYTKTSHTTHSQALEMPENESRNPRLVTHPRASRSSYNLKDPPEFGFRRIPGSQEALPSFSKYLERFYPKALYDYLSRRETLERELSIFHAAHPRVMEKARLEPNSVEQCRVLQTQHDELVAAYEIELSSQRRELHAQYEWKYDDFRRKELLEAVERKARYTRKLSVLSAEPTTDLVYTLDRSAGPLPSNTHRETGPRADPVAVSNPKTPNPPERVQLTRSKASPSSTKPDPPSAPRRLKTSPPSVSRELLPARKLMTEGRKPLKSGLETASTDTISRPLPRSRERAKAREQPNRTVLDREPPKGSSLMGAKPASRVDSAPAPKLLKSTPVTSVRARTPPSSSPSSRVISTLRTSHAISTHQVVNKTTHQKYETRSRVSRELASSRFGEKPSVYALERSNEHSKVDIGLAVKLAPALTLLSAEVGEGRRVTDTVVSIHNGEKEDEYSHKPSAALTLPASAPVTLSVPPMRVISQLHRSVDPIPPFEVISRRRDLNDVNKTSSGSATHSPEHKTARKRSHPPFSPSGGEGGGQLARAAAYMRERIAQRSSAFDEFVCRSPKAPPDKVTESDTTRHVPDVASEGKRFSEAVGSLQPRLDVEMFPSQPKAQRLSKERSESIPKSAEPACDMSDVGGQERCSVLPIEAVEAIRCSVEHLDEISEISEEPVVPALEDVGQSCRGSAKRQPELLVVSETETSAYPHSPITLVSLMPLPQSPAVPLQAKSIDRQSLGLDWLLLKPPDGVGFEWCLHDTVSLNPLPSVVRHSPKHQGARRPPIPKPGHPS